MVGVGNGIALVNAGKPEEALKLFDESIELDRRCAEAYVGRATVRALSTNYQSV